MQKEGQHVKKKRRRSEEGRYTGKKTCRTTAEAVQEVDDIMSITVIHHPGRLSTHMSKAHHTATHLTAVVVGDGTATEVMEGMSI